MNKPAKTIAKSTNPIKSNLKDIMINSGIREVDLVNATEISQATISRYRNCVDIPNHKKAERIVKAINNIASTKLSLNDVWENYEQQYRANLVNTLRARAEAGRKSGMQRKTKKSKK